MEAVAEREVGVVGNNEELDLNLSVCVVHVQGVMGWLMDERTEAQLSSSPVGGGVHEPWMLLWLIFGAG